ncbi:MAG: carbohydrate kinase family protein [Anaerolineae bacterium]|nr:carbohydrate kinase family protein [Anaerolineae bacterium]MCB0206621.1 carbohydrate kinase family protein [Anaerolineae bacterium]MCB0255657.1 carbohydrate kinase family protein [Anaerolineae bacterium]
MPSSDSEFDVICYGTISADNIVYVPYIPTPRRDSQVQAEFSRLGGEAATVARVLSTWGLRVAIVGNILGEDRWGNFIRQELASYSGIDTRYVTTQPGVRSPFCRIMVTPDGERSILGYWFDETPKSRLDEDMMRRARLLSVDVYGQSERDEAARIARALGRTVVSADAIWPNYPLAGLSDIIVISRDFLTSYFPGVYIYDHALGLQQAGAGSVVVTHGKKPVLVVDEHGRPATVEPFPVRAIDTTGAGDVFKAAVIYGHLQGWDLMRATRFACAASALYVGQSRGDDAVPSLERVRRLAGS